ncbi:putative bifunctional diguanylate cyclase/phosphodiesterase [Actinospongicola halichondriae]|uniref:putative bifunctional diguanylate cyclase/phosphodiesterase n=1 Tax=Actinospongicola halichondriae TaxID=3236844 RepID=UPI003D3D179B
MSGETRAIRELEQELEQVRETSIAVRAALGELLQVDEGDVDAAIDLTLASLGSLLHVDRAYVFRADGDRMTNTHEWCAAGIVPQIDDLVDLPLDTVRAWIAPFRRGEHIQITDVTALPDERTNERELLQPQGIQSLLVVPMLSLGELVGFVGFDSVRGRREFGVAEVEALRTAADTMTAVEVRRRANRDARDAQARLAALTTHSTDLVLTIDDAGDILYASNSWRTVGHPPDGLVGHTWRDMVHPDHHHQIALAFGERRPAVSRLPDFRLRRTEPPTWLSGTVADLRTDPVIGAFVLNAHEVTERRNYEKQMEFDALHDRLTGLGNRVLFDDRLTNACRRASRTGDKVAVAFLDVDHFKVVNDSHGHGVGDQVLRAVAARIASVVRPGDLVSRFGGDEFVVLLDGIESLEFLDACCPRILDSLTEPIVVGDIAYDVSASIGVAHGAGTDLEPSDLVRDADTAMYRSKDLGRSRVTRFDASLHIAVVRRSEIVARIRDAISREDIEVHFQPVVELTTGRIVGAECLARWSDPDLGDIGPAEFVPIAEQSAMVVALDELVLRRAGALLARLPESIGVSVNVSAQEFGDADLPLRFARTIDDHALDGNRLTIEITETALIRDPGRTAELVRELQGYGVSVALDDFGVGFSSLALLQALPIDILKIDRSFVRGAIDSARNRHLVAAVANLARDLDIVAVAEGISSEGDVAAMTDLGLRLGQGFHFGRAIPADEFVERVTGSHSGDSDPRQ